TPRRPGAAWSGVRRRAATRLATPPSNAGWSATMQTENPIENSTNGSRMETAELDRVLAAVRDEAFLALRDAMPAANLEAALRCSARLLAALPHRDQLYRNVVLV